MEYIENTETAYEINANIDGLKSFVTLTLHNEHYKEGKFALTLMGDALNAFNDEAICARILKAVADAATERNRALKQMKSLEAPENLVTY